ncbi:hypothetical protein SAMN05660209_02675 [Geodermatophilus africanus]|uniref:Uncharacterized protein n=1 Tax=Geodermatophilus africanus TaxID=1137993 RepID=A0A1H3J7Y5_9ACTN|nr:hypothetical protein [Geodermatophilus africanus]SDY35669.1 hypothetical protein SAMN05660209_02675 [Geodermatophilus africanus]
MSKRARSKKRRRTGRDVPPSRWPAVVVVAVVAALMAVVVVETGSVSGVWTVVAAVAVVLALLGLGLWSRR